MNDRLETLLQVALLLLVVAFIAGHAIGQPVFVSYVETGSMEPTIEAGDGFLVVPAALAGPPESGDVIVFRAEVLHNGSVTTHRIVGSAGDGYVTQGDANTFPDQQGVEPPVTDDRVLGKAVTVNDDVIVVPGLGRGVRAVKEAAGSILSVAPLPETRTDGGGSSAVFFGIGLCLVGAGLVMGFNTRMDRDTSRATRRREAFDVRRLTVAFVVSIVLLATVAMLLASGTVQYGLVAVEDDPVDDQLVLESGSSGLVSHDLQNSGFVPVVVIRESPDEDVHVVRRTTIVGPRSAAETALRVDAPDSPGRFERSVSERRYVAALPPTLITALDSVHPWLALLAVNVVLSLAVLLACAVGWPGKYVRVRTTAGRDRWRRFWRLVNRQG